MGERRMPARGTLRARFFKNLRKTSPLLIARIFIATILYFPWLALSIAGSWKKMRHWRKRKTCLRFIERHRLAFEEFDLETLRINPVSGGVSNANQIWRLNKHSGEEVTYFVKVFVPAGSFWAKHLSVVSPFPVVYGTHLHERFAVDIISRVQLADVGVPVPKLVVYDAVETVMITQYLHGKTLDQMLDEITSYHRIGEEAEEAIRQCAIALARTHTAGFSLIDTQPVNCIWVQEEKKVYFTDLEFCTRQDKRVWDVGFFLCFLALRLPEDLKDAARDLFLENYQKERRLNMDDVGKIGQELKEYYPVFRTILDIRQYTPEELFAELSQF